MFMTYQGKTIKKHTRGNWFVRVRHNGKVTSIYGRTKLETYDKLKAVVDKIENDRVMKSAEKLLAKFENTATYNFAPTPTTTQAEIIAKPTTYTLREWFDEWLTSYKVGNVRIATIVAFKRSFNQLEKIHDIEIDKITNLMLSKTLNECASCCRMRIQVRSLLKQMFGVAFNNRLVESNPTLDIPRPKVFVKTQKRVLTPEQEKKFIALCLADLEKYEPFIICCLQGLRKGEMLALKPNDFDFERNTLRIDESFDYNYPADMQVKNHTSNRIMPMFETTKQILLKYRDSGNQDEMIYSKTSYSVWWKRLCKLLKENGLPRLTMHELRHTFITRCHEKGIDEIVVQKWVGHVIGSAITKSVYTHVNDDAERNYIEKMNGTNN